MSAATLSTETLHPDHGGEDNALFGFWVYLMTDCILFASLFATYAVMRHNYAGGPTGKDLFDLRYVFIETMFLLFSSFSNGFAMLSMHRRSRLATLKWLLLTALLGLGFVGMEVHEFTHLVMEGNGPDRSGFLSAFFGLVGTHGAHVSIGLIWMGVMMWQLYFKGVTPAITSRLLRLSLFWHFLDIIWIVVFTVVYLMGVI
ncbi:MAG: cytochrome o ubiquinol oxidase subunit III [Gallionella sp.]